ncbi:MAG: DegT/DnrJ/EryC1/StrS family aminotransferase [Candidatus Nealsonbacteria bacterium]
MKNILKAKFSLIKSVDPAKIAQKLAVYFPDKQFVFTDMARDAFKVIIEKMDLANTTMMLPAYICDVFYPILKYYNITPIFLDIDLKTFHIKLEEIKNKITPEVKSVLVCHTYGLPVDIKAVKAITGEGVIVIEDCAHAFLAEKSGVFAGNLGDVSFFSLYKQLPALRGGMLVCPQSWRIDLPETFFNLRDFLSFLNYFWPFAFFFKKFGSDYAKAHLRESKLQKPGGIIKASLSFFGGFFDEFRGSLEKRKQLALIFQKELEGLGFEVQESSDNVFCYLSVLAPKNLTEKRDEIVSRLKKYRIFCTRIWKDQYVIILNKDIQKEYQIDLAEFPNTIEASRRIINFPLQNYYQEKDVKKMIQAVKKVILSL